MATLNNTTKNNSYLVNKGKKDLVVFKSWTYDEPGIAYNENNYFYEYFKEVIQGISKRAKNLISITTKDKN